MDTPEIIAQRALVADAKKLLWQMRGLERNIRETNRETHGAFVELHQSITPCVGLLEKRIAEAETILWQMEGANSDPFI